MLGEPEGEGNSSTLKREGENLERQPLIWALKDLCNLDRMKRAEKGFTVGRHRDKQNIGDIWDRARSLGGTSARVLWVMRSLEQWAEGGTAVSFECLEAWNPQNFLG